MIRGDHYSRRCNRTAHERELDKRSSAGEQASPRAKHDGMDQEDELVDHLRTQIFLHFV